MSRRNKYAIIEWPLFDAPKSTHRVFTSCCLSRYCCLHFCRNKFGLILAQGYFTGQRSSIIHKLQLFMTLCDMQSLSGHYLMRYQVPTVSLLLSLKCCCLHFCRSKFGLLLVQGYFKGQISRIYHKLQLCMTLCDMQSSRGNYSMRHQVPMVFLLLLIYLSAVTCISEKKKFGSMLAQGYFRGQRSSINQKL